ncbi:hypothetical protein IWW34DRAFT_839051 [Fusarium oxysporum f. sp. albedinis]|nr:hypothetical protein IWW34DRAFT_839051 [Fusarium oxysporum f. sp. albedinis]
MYNTRHVHSHQRRASRAPSPEGTFLLVASPTEKTPRRLERCSVDEVVASFHGLQPVRPIVEPGRVPGDSRGCKEEEVLWAVRDCRDRSCSFRAAKRATNHVGASRSRAQGAQKVEQLAAAGVVRAAKAAEVGRGSAKLQRQDAANVVWAARAAEVGRTGSRGAQSPDCRRLAKPECRGKKKPPEGDVKSSRSSMSLQTLVAKKGQLSESLSSGSC